MFLAVPTLVAGVAIALKHHAGTSRGIWTLLAIAPEWRSGLYHFRDIAIDRPDTANSAFCRARKLSLGPVT